MNNGKADNNNPTPQHGWIRWDWILAAAAGALLFYIAVTIFPRLFALYWYPDIKLLLYEDLGWSEAWSSFFGFLGSLVFAVLWVPLLGYALLGRHRLWALAFLFVAYGTPPLLHAVFGSEVCFNQRTGEALKWYVVEPGGQIVLYDSPGFDAAGTPKRPATPVICHVIKLQKRGIRPRQIAEDPRYVNFFDDISGQPVVWYSKAADGRIDLFDAEGVHPASGEPLIPVTPLIVTDARAQAAARAEEAEQTAQASAARAEAEAKDAAARAEAAAKQKAHDELVNLFGVASYPNGAVLLGVATRNKDDESGLAARQVLRAFRAELVGKGLAVDELRPAVYSSGRFDSLMTGDTSVLADVGLAQKMHSAVLSFVDATCHAATQAVGVTACTVTAEVRVVRPEGVSTVGQVSETGSSTNRDDALARAVELLAQRHPELFDGA